MFCEKNVLRKFAKFTGKRLCQSLFFNKVAGPRPHACTCIKKNTLTQVLSCEISKNTSSYRTPLVAASDIPAVYTQRLEASGFHCYNLISFFHIRISTKRQAFDFFQRNSYTKVCLKFLYARKLMTPLLILTISSKNLK